MKEENRHTEIRNALFEREDVVSAIDDYTQDKLKENNYNWIWILMIVLTIFTGLYIFKPCPAVLVPSGFMKVKIDTTEIINLNK